MGISIVVKAPNHLHFAQSAILNEPYFTKVKAYCPYNA